MVGSAGSIVWGQSILIGWVLLTCGIARGQTPDSLSAMLFTDADSGWFDDLMERDWDTTGMWRTRLQRSDGIPASSLGGPLGAQSRLNLTIGSLSFSLFLEKNTGEPLGPTSRARWRGPERKRVSLSLDRTRWEVHLGPFRQHVGFGLVAGRSAGWAPALSAPLAIPDILPRAGARTGSAGDPVPSGITLLLKGPRGRIGMFHGHTWHAASLERDDHGEWTVMGPSGTAVFATHSSLQRRRQLGMTLSGWTGALQGQDWAVATMLALVQASSRLLIEGRRVPLGFSGQTLMGSLSIRRRLGTWEVAAESALMGTAAGYEWSVRWKPSSGKGVRIGGLRLADPSRSPFGREARFQSTWQFERIRHASASWRVGNHDFVMVGALRDRKSVEWITRNRLGASWTFQRGPGMALTAFSIRELESDTRWRWGARLGLPIRNGIAVDIQTQVGLRRQPGASHRTSRLVATGLRARRAGWDFHAFMMRRLGGTGTTVLYVAIPSMQGGFPVLGGSSDRWLSVFRVRRHIGHRLDLESWWRWERDPSGTRHAGRFQWQVQSTLRF